MQLQFGLLKLKAIYPVKIYEEDYFLISVRYSHNPKIIGSSWEKQAFFAAVRNWLPFENRPGKFYNSGGENE